MYVHYDLEKATIETAKATIEKSKINVFIERIQQTHLFGAKSMEHIQKLYEGYGAEGYFGRTDVQKVTGLGGTRAYELLKSLQNIQMIEVVSGHGKGKYKFRKL